MDQINSKLRRLAKNRYFAYIAVIFLAFVTALIIYLINNNQNQTKSNNIEGQFYNPQGNYTNSSGNNTPNSTNTGPVNNGNQPAKSKSALDVILEAIGLKQKTASNTNPDNTSSQNNNQQKNKITPVPTKTAAQEKEQLEAFKNQALPVPEIKIDNYVLSANLPTTPEQATLLLPKTNYTRNEFNQIAKLFGIENQSLTYQDSDGDLNTYSLSNGSHLAFNTVRGYFSFFSDKGIVINQASDPEQIAKLFINQIGIDSSLFSAPVLYRRATRPSSTFAEFHLDWNVFGAPLYNSVGALNLSQNTKMADIQPGQVAPDAPKDSDIVWRSDGVTGHGSSEDFNTLTVEVKNNKIVAASSNIPYSFNQEIISKDKIIPAETIIESLKKGSTVFDIAVPAGEGTINLTDAFANNQANAKQVNIIDAIYGIDMTPYVSDNFCPSYTIRSVGKTESGYDTVFVQTLPAINDPRCTKNKLTGPNVGVLGLNSNLNPAPSGLAPTLVAPEKAGSDTWGIDYRTFMFTPKLPVHSSSDCPPFNHTYKISEDLYLAWYDDNPEGTKLGSKDAERRKWYWVKVKTGDETASDEELKQQAIDSLSQLDKHDFESLRIKLITRCTLGDLNDCEKPQGFDEAIVECRYMTYGSPSIYFYPLTKTYINLTINSNSPISYLDPGFNINNGWNLSAYPDGKIEIGSISKTNLYWEYDTTKILKYLKSYHDNSGYVVKNNNIALTNMLNMIANSLKLNNREKSDLLSELKREARKISADKITVSFVNEKVLNQFFNYNIKPMPDNFHRIILYIRPAVNNGDSLKTPYLSPLLRSGFSVIETGVITDLTNK